MEGQAYRCHADLKVGGTRLNACLDTGASRTIMSHRVWNSLDAGDLCIRRCEPAVNLFAAGDRPIFVHGESEVTFRFQGGRKPFTWKFVIADIESPHYDCLVGVDFLTEVGACLDIGAGMLTCRTSSRFSRKLGKAVPVSAICDKIIYPGTVPTHVK